MLIETKEKLIRFLQKIINSIPGVSIKDFEAEAFQLEMELRQSCKVPKYPYPEELTKLIMNLPEYQKEHYETVSWLLNPMGPRRTGKSHLMALATIEHSLMFNIWMPLKNHSANVQSMYEQREMLELVHKIMEPLSKKLLLQVKKNPNRNNITEIKVIRKQEECLKWNNNTTNPWKLSD